MGVESGQAALLKAGILELARLVLELSFASGHDCPGLTIIRGPRVVAFDTAKILGYCAPRPLEGCLRVWVFICSSLCCQWMKFELCSSSSAIQVLSLNSLLLLVAFIHKQPSELPLSAS